MNEMNEILCKLLWGQLQSMGLSWGQIIVRESIEKIGIGDIYARWLEESLAVLKRNDYLNYDGTSYFISDARPIELNDVWKEWNIKKDQWLKDPGLKARVLLIEETVQALPDILTGKVSATDILFPNSSMKLAEGIYKNNSVFESSNEILADTAVAYLQERLEEDPGERIRILEIGAGCGATSSMVFQKLKPFQDSIWEYCYTDLSEAFLMQAEREYPENPYLTYKTLDMEKPIAGQGIDEGGFDIVIAANVLHAAQDVRLTLRNIKAALKHNGLILINELSSNSLFYHLTLGLLEEWWSYKDPALRIPGCPALYPETWQTVLESEGFNTIFFPAAEAHQFGQQIIVAESDGVVRQSSHCLSDISSVPRITDEIVISFTENPSVNILEIQEHILQNYSDIDSIEAEIAKITDGMDELLYRLLWGQLRSMGLFMEKIPDNFEDTGLISMYREWFDESKAMLARQNYLRYEKKTYTVIDTMPINIDDLWQEWDLKKESWLRAPNLKAKVVLVEATMRALPQILTGKRLATDIIFPRASMVLIEGIYKNNIVSDYFNKMLADMVVTYVQERISDDPSLRIRILEIGAGTGGTSAVVFEKLRPYQEYIQEYCYTDISRAFLLHAEKEYGQDNPYLTYKIFNAEKSVDKQEIDIGSYDLVIAANVLHATQSIQQTLHNTKALLKKNGWLLLNELSSNTIFYHLTVGFLEGWWLYKDNALRIPGCPALYPETWRTVLNDEGFRSVCFPVTESHRLGQQVIICESDGVVRPKQPAQTTVLPVSNQARNTESSPELQSAAGEEIKTGLLREKSVAFFKKTVGEVLKIPFDMINSAEPLETYGIDSIFIVELNDVLHKVFGEISNTLFFEYQTIDALTDYFLATQKDELISYLGLQGNKTTADDLPVNKNENSKIPAVYPRHKIIKPERSLANLDRGYERMENHSSREPIAIIGMSGRFPRANNMQEFWRVLQSGKDCITEIPEDRWPMEGFFYPDPDEAIALVRSYSKWGGFIDGFADFDPLFFNISPREVLEMDPQERLFIQSCWSVLEDAGYTREQLAKQYHGRIGVFAGITKTGFDHYGPELWNKGEQIFPHTQFSSVSNRVSYLFNLNGPSIPFDTMCSSSLTAVHEACEHLRQGECEMAIAGAVNLFLHPTNYAWLCSMRMLSPDGRCRAFGKGANGFVPAEGVGTLLLKRLSQATRDRDCIYAVIKGSSINHGGKTNGYKVPNPVAQGELIKSSLDKAGVNARAVSYIEAHGTGTELGDPIEITGLAQAFGRDTKDQGFCGIGSVKSNIGHAEAAAGIAGIAKIVLQMKHQQLVPSLHARELNPLINFAATPFVVQQELTEWKRPVINGQEMPRIAGVSSFGAGGANAHVVIEEYIPEDMVRPEIMITPQNPAIIVLSAKNKERLQEQAQQLLAAIEEEHFSDSSLADIAYTLQVGREAMEERLGVIVGSIQELIEKLEGFVEGKDRIDELYLGQVKRNKDALSVLAGDEEMQETITKWFERGKYTKLLDLWVKGLNFDWNLLYGKVKPRRISLPTYPFTRERYWITETDLQSASPRTSQVISAVLHPLLQENTSNLSGQRYSSTFTGKEFFLEDHIVQGQRILPGVAYLEMARAAIEYATQGLVEGQSRIQLKNVIWARPIAVEDQPVQVHIGLDSEENGEIAYEIYTRPGSREAEPVIYSQGSAILQQVIQAPSIDLASLQAQCSQRRLTPGQCYDQYQEMGFEYGPGHRGIEEVYIGSDQVLARLSLPSSISNTQDQYVLHPSLMDGALQASIGLTMGSGDNKPLLPFALQELEVYGSCTSAMWALIKYSDGRKTSDKVQKMDIDLCDEEGKVCVCLRGFSSRVLESDETERAGAGDSLGTVMLKPVWQEAPAIRKGVYEYTDHLVIISEPSEVDCEKLTRQMKGLRCLTLESRQDSAEERFTDYAVLTFEEIQSILQDKAGGKVLIQIVTFGEDEQQFLRGLSGLLKTAQLENPKIIGQIIEMEAGESLAGIIEKLKENSQNPLDEQIRYQDGKRYVLGWNDIEIKNKEEKIPWRDQGVYLISGGAGALGLIFAREIAQKAKDVTLILTERSAPHKDQQAYMNELNALGARVEYRQVDVTSKAAVNDLLQQIRKRFGTLDGIIHSAGVIRDNYIIRKSREELEEVLAPKVKGLVNLDQASKDMELDFFILFSSMAGALGSSGQADYSTANAFMDAYAGYRNKLVAIQQRQGKTLSINWPLWQEGGMKVDEETKKTLMQTMGLTPMETRRGIQALYQGLSLGSQVMVLNGDIKQIRIITWRQTTAAKVLSYTSRANKTVPVVDEDLLLKKTINYLKSILSSIIKLPGHRIEADAPLEKYGIDSLMVMKMTNQLQKTFGSLPKTLLFEYPNLKELAGYFIESYQDQLMELLGMRVINEDGENIKAAVVMPETVKPSLNNLRRPLQPAFRQEPTSGVMDVAIIGLTGRYPQASNMEKFWINLGEGRDCIIEIPEDRWDNDLYFDENKGMPGKTYSKWGGFIEDVDRFDPLFFNISPREAEIIDPQERLFMETVWNLLEESGYTPTVIKDSYQSRVGVFVGAMYQHYHSIKADIVKESDISISSFSSIANRTSYYFDLLGPSIAIDTMCSSASVAIHMACESLIKGECVMAIAGGVNLSIHPHKYVGLSRTETIGSHIGSRSFADGDGYLPAEGVGAVLLKPLAHAIKDHDSILAVIKSTAINHSGRSNGYSVPNPNAQAQLMEENFKKSGVEPRTISYVEAAANGSALGDAIEIAALKKAFRIFTSDNQFCAIGAVKSNIGHAEAASGISQLSKVILQLQHKKLVPTIKADPMNPNISFDDTPFYLQRELEDWRRPVLTVDGEEREFPRRATVSSFGAGGSNAHLILEEYIPLQEEQEEDNMTPIDSPQIIVLSAKNQDRLLAVAGQILELVEHQEDLRLPDLAYTLQVHREPMECRLALVVETREELSQALQAILQFYHDVSKLVSETPIFIGNMDEDQMQVKSLLSGKVEDYFIKTIMGNKDLEKIAFYWTQGGIIPWKSLYPEQGVKRVALPTYPFARERYWVVDKTEAEYRKTVTATFKEPQHKYKALTLDTNEPKQKYKAVASSSNKQSQRFEADGGVQQYIQNYMVQFLSKELHIDQDQIKLNKNIREYGIHSIEMTKMIRNFEKDFRIKITGREMLQFSTVNSLSAYLASKVEALNKHQITPLEQMTKSEPINKQADERESDTLKKFKRGELTLEEMESLLDEGVIV